MCGIAGIVNGGTPNELQRMADVQVHRGIDDAGLEWFEEFHSGLAHRRLSILDLSEAGHQPMVNHSGTRWITYNGEIYNYRELREQLTRLGHRFASNTDTEVILAAYDEWGSSAVERFNGMFAFGIFDTESGELFLARDQLGIKPLYFAQRGSMLAFASESKALFEVSGVERVVDPDALASALLLLWVPEPKTGYQGISKLEPGHWAIYRDGRLRMTKYWDIPSGQADPDGREPTENELVEELRDILERAVRRQMISDVPVGALLSGGLDSSLVVALMRRMTQGPISTYTIRFSSQDKQMEAMSDDAGYASKVSRLFSTDHHEILAAQETNDLLPMILWHLDDPVADSASINTYLIASAAKAAGTTVLLNGMGGDEVFAGYRKQLATLLVARYLALPRTLRRGAIEPLVKSLPVAIGGRGLRRVRWSQKFIRSVLATPMDSFIRGFAYFTPDQVEEILVAPSTPGGPREMYPFRRYYEVLKRAEGRPLLDQMTYLDTKLFLPGLNLLYSDKCAMAASVEGRPPLVDIELVEFAARLPVRYKINGRVQKYILKKAAEAYLPHDVIYRPKAPFGSPLRSWMRQGFAADIGASFATIESKHSDYLRPGVPNQLLQEQLAGRADHAHSLFGIYALITWLGNAER